MYLLFCDVGDCICCGALWAAPYPHLRVASRAVACAGGSLDGAFFAQEAVFRNALEIVTFRNPPIHRAAGALVCFTPCAAQLGLVPLALLCVLAHGCLVVSFPQAPAASLGKTLRWHATRRIVSAAAAAAALTTHPFVEQITTTMHTAIEHALGDSATLLLTDKEVNDCLILATFYSSRHATKRCRECRKKCSGPLDLTVTPCLCGAPTAKKAITKFLRPKKQPRYGRPHKSDNVNTHCVNTNHVNTNHVNTHTQMKIKI